MWIPPGVTPVPNAYKPPFHRALKIEVGLGPNGEGVAWVELDRDIHYGAKWAHGGLVGALADVSSAIGIARRFEEPLSAVEGTIEMKVNFLRKGVEGDLTATATLLRLGKRIAVSEVDITSQGQLVAKALASFMVSEKAH